MAASLAAKRNLDERRLKEAFGTFPTGVVAVAAIVDGELMGLAASSFTTVSLDPPLLSISLRNQSRTWPTLRQAEHLGVTVLADHHGELARQLAGDAERRFDGVDISVTPAGAVTVLDGLARFDTTIHREVEAGDHTLVLLELHVVEHGDGAQPLVFHRSGFRRLDRS